MIYFAIWGWQLGLSQQSILPTIVFHDSKSTLYEILQHLELSQVSLAKILTTDHHCNQVTLWNLCRNYLPHFLGLISFLFLLKKSLTFLSISNPALRFRNDCRVHFKRFYNYDIVYADDTVTLPPAPIICLLSTDGTLLLYHTLNQLPGADLSMVQPPRPINLHGLLFQPPISAQPVRATQPVQVAQPDQVAQPVPPTQPNNTSTPAAQPGKPLAPPAGGMASFGGFSALTAAMQAPNMAVSSFHSSLQNCKLVLLSLWQLAVSSDQQCTP